MAGSSGRPAGAGVCENGEFLHFDIRALIDIDQRLGALVTAVQASAREVFPGKGGQGPFLFSPSLDGDLGGRPVADAQRVFLRESVILTGPPALLASLEAT